jgi:hypothetical protein
MDWLNKKIHNSESNL